MTVANELNALVAAIAEACGFERVPPVVFRRGAGGDWQYQAGLIRIGRKGTSNPDRLWGVVAHELAHAQAAGREGHALAFWRRLAAGLERAGRIELLRYEFGYRERVLKVAREHGLDAPNIEPFAFGIDQRLTTSDSTQWRVRHRFRRAGEPAYRLTSRRWVWTVSEEILVGRLHEATRAIGQ